MAATLDGQLVAAISSRALFDFEEENRLFETGDDRAYMQLQLDRLEQPAQPGVAFSLVHKLLAFNDATAQRVEVVILSRNDPVSGMRVFRSAQHYGLPIQRGSFTRGQPPWRYLRPLHANLFLSTHLSDVRAALEAGVPAAQVYPQSAHASDAHPNEVRIAFDGDAVLFSDESERIYQAQGLDAFSDHEAARAHEPPPSGPFKGFLTALHALQNRFPEAACPIRTALVTARQAPAHKRVIHTLRAWNIRIDEAFFLGGLEKQAFLSAFRADIFFDDHPLHCERAKNHVPTGHVPNGIVNQ